MITNVLIHGLSLLFISLVFSFIDNDESTIQLKVLDIYHQNNHSFAVFNEAIQFCRMAWVQHGNVLIYCLTGIDASAVIATSIVMNMTGMSHMDAMYWVKMRRRCTDIRGIYLRLLQVNRQIKQKSSCIDNRLIRIYLCICVFVCLCFYLGI
jgi:protein-tyrosine phosphatase